MADGSAGGETVAGGGGAHDAAAAGVVTSATAAAVVLGEAGAAGAAGGLEAGAGGAEAVVPAGGTPRRTLSARQVAEALGMKSDRIVGMWAAGVGQYRPACPSSPGGKKKRLFNLEEVIAWRRSMGLAERGVSELFVAGDGKESGNDPQIGKDGRRGDAAGAGGAAGAGLGTLAEEAVRQVRAMLGRMGGEISSNAAAQFGTAVSALERVARQQQQQQREEDERLDRVMERAVALRLLNRLAGSIRSQVGGAAAVLPDLVRDAVLAAKVSDPASDAFVRVAGVAVRSWADQTLDDLAAEVEKMGRQLQPGLAGGAAESRPMGAAA